MGLDALLENEHGHWPNFQKFHINSLFTPGVELFSLYEQQFPRYGWIFNIAIFGHKTWPLTKVPEVAHILSLSLSLSTPGVEIELIFAVRAAVSEIRADFPKCHI